MMNITTETTRIPKLKKKIINMVFYWFRLNLTAFFVCIVNSTITDLNKAANGHLVMSI